MPSDKQKKRKKGHRFQPGNKYTENRDRENSGGNSRRRIPDQQENGDLQGEHKEKSAGLTYQHGGGMAGYLMSTAELRAPPPTSTLLQQKKGTATRASGKKNKNKMRLIHLEKNNEMWNTAIHQHNQQTSCRNPQFTQDKEKRWGIGIKQSLKCTNCKFKTPLFKLYEEAKGPPRPGPKQAAASVSLQVALADSSIANTKARALLSALDLQVPCRTRMDKTAKRVADEMVQVAETGMKEKLAEVTNESNELQISADTRYNCCRPALSRRTGEMTTTQAATFAMEKKSKNNYIVAKYAQNKICIICSKHGFNAPPHDCTANLHRFESLSEKTAGRSIGQYLLAQGAKVTYCTTDGDAQFKSGLQEVSPHPIKRQADTQHLGLSVVKKGKKAVWSEDFFNRPRDREGTKKEEQDQQKKLDTAVANDLKNRSFAVLYQLHEKHSGQLSEIKAEAPAAVEAIIRCYQGDCSQCTAVSTACKAGVSQENWLSKSRSLQQEKIGYLKPTMEDEQQMRAILNMVLGDAGLEKTELLSNTQPNESVNRSMSVSLPKNIKHSKTFEGRLAMVTDKWNFGPGAATARMNDRLGVALSDGQKHFLSCQQRSHELKKQWNRSERTKKKRLQRDAAVRKARKAYTPSTTSDYRKDQLDIDTTSMDGDHSYPSCSVAVSYFFLL